MNNKKTYYVLSHSSNRKPMSYIGLNDFGTSNLPDAARYDSLADAVCAAAERASWLRIWDGGTKTQGKQWGIVKVTETPGKTVRAIVSQSQIDAKLPCVITDGGEFVCGEWHRTPNLDDAKLFGDLNDALGYIEREYCAQNYGKRLHVYNVSNHVEHAHVAEEVMN